MTTTMATTKEEKERNFKSFHYARRVEVILIHSPPFTTSKYIQFFYPSLYPPSPILVRFVLRQKIQKIVVVIMSLYFSCHVSLLLLFVVYFITRTTLNEQNPFFATHWIHPIYSDRFISREFLCSCECFSSSSSTHYTVYTIECRVLFGKSQRVFTRKRKERKLSDS
jgi:hypothetical protein